MTDRSALYVDGFNMYHAIASLEQPFLKWVDLWQLGANIIESTEELVKVAYCTAYYPGDHKKWIRHNAYIKALQLRGVTVCEGHYITEPQSCKGCGRKWDKPTEKASDINLALSMIQDAFDDVYDVAYLVTADSDHAATAKLLKGRYPTKRLVSVAPPGMFHSQNIVKNAAGSIRLTEFQIERAVLPNVVLDTLNTGKPPVRRPDEYAPLPGWVHPDQRRKKKDAP